MDNKSNLDTILLVEDDEDHGSLIIDSLQEEDRLLNGIHWVKNGREAIDYITRMGKNNQDNAPTPA